MQRLVRGVDVTLFYFCNMNSVNESPLRLPASELTIEAIGVLKELHTSPF